LLRLYREAWSAKHWGGEPVTVVIVCNKNHPNWIYVGLGWSVMYSISRLQTCFKFRKSSYSKTWSRVWLFCNSDTIGSCPVTVKTCVYLEWLPNADLSVLQFAVYIGLFYKYHLYYLSPTNHLLANKNYINYNCKFYKLYVYFICCTRESSWFFNNKKHKMLHGMNSIKIIFFAVLHT
jgi:hypothetical protein